MLDPKDIPLLKYTMLHEGDLLIWSKEDTRVINTGDECTFISCSVDDYTEATKFELMLAKNNRELICGHTAIHDFTIHKHLSEEEKFAYAVGGIQALL